MFDSPSVAAYTADRAPSHARGRYQSALGVTYGLAFTVGPILGTAVYQWRREAVWYASAVLGVVGAALAVAAERHPDPVRGG
jgi:MFS family permease